MFLGLGIGIVAVPAQRHGPPSRTRPLAHAHAPWQCCGLAKINKKKKSDFIPDPKIRPTAPKWYCTFREDIDAVAK